MGRYASGIDLVARHDVNLIGDLATDDREELAAASVPTHVNVLTALDDASGAVEAALQRGGQYSVADLQSLTDNSLALLKRVVCLIAMAFMFERRAGVHQEKAEWYFERAGKYLEDLQKGKNVFNLPLQVEAGMIDHGGLNVVQ